MEYFFEFPADFQQCVAFHGHLCPGLAIGYAAVKAAEHVLGMDRAPDEELVAIVENDSCAVDAVQVLTGCTFGKGNLLFRDWGKQVFTFLDRNTGRGVRVSLLPGSLPGTQERQALKSKIDSGQAGPEERNEWARQRQRAALDLIEARAEEAFEVRDVTMEHPPKARIVETGPCAMCGELTMTSRLVEGPAGLMCAQCAQDVS
jgi:formylmethanofuran dehydrogenase subunit E